MNSVVCQRGFADGQIIITDGSGYRLYIGANRMVLWDDTKFDSINYSEQNLNPLPKNWIAVSAIL